MPVGEIGRQFLAAGVMAGAVRGFETLLEVGTDVEHNFAMVALLVAVGASTYLLTLFALSTRFRTTVLANSPAGVAYPRAELRRPWYSPVNTTESISREPRTE